MIATILMKVCVELNKVRSIADLDKTDVVIEAHRGLWGEPNGHQENTIGAMIAAQNLGIKLLESDVVPADIADGGVYKSELSAVPQSLACYHDMILTRYTSQTDDSKRIYNSTREELKNLLFKKPRSEEIGNERILFYDELIDFAVSNNLIVCVDMKGLQRNDRTCNNATSSNDLCDWWEGERRSQSLYQSFKYAINNTDEAKLQNISFKTYLDYDELRNTLTTGINAVSEIKFDKVLWVPIVAPNPQWQISPDVYEYDTTKIQKKFDDWFAHNESVLYYETNFFNDYDGRSSVMLQDSFCFIDSSGNLNCSNLMEYIYNMSGRRSGIFSVEPVGGKGTVDSWNNWSIMNPDPDRRGDHLWLLSKPFFKHAVIVTERPEQWKALND